MDRYSSLFPSFQLIASEISKSIKQLTQNKVWKKPLKWICCEMGNSEFEMHDLRKVQTKDLH